MSIEIKCYKHNVCKLLDVLFDNEKDNLIPLSSNHVTINNVNHFFNDNEQYYLQYNKYGQMSIQIQRDKHTQLHMDFNAKDLTELWITAPNKFGEINPKTNKVYNELFVFKIHK